MIRGILGLAVCAALAACSFDHGAAAPILVDFASPTSLQDHQSGTVMIPVRLSKASKDPIFVSYTVGGTAVAGVDYDVQSDPMLAFAPGATEVDIVISIHYTADEGPDTTVDLSLDNPNGADLGKTAMHVMTISGVILPRVSFENDTSAASETMDQMVNVVLDKASPIGTSVDLALGGTAVPGTDYTLAPGTLVFPAGQTSYPLDLGVVHDGEYNNDVTVVMTLSNASKMIVGSPATHTHTITEVDLPPVVKFAQGAAMAKETVGTPVTVNVTLASASRLPVTVPFSVDNANTTASPSQYSITTTSPLTFPPGTTTLPISITLVDDGVAEADKTLAILLGSPTGGTLGTPKSYTLTIQDDDQTCTGMGSYQVCVQKPSAPANLTGTLNTDTDPRCTTPFSGWGGGEPTSCFIVGTTISVTGTLQVTGSLPLVLLASDQITVAGTATIDAASHTGGTTGPGSPYGTCAGSNGTKSAGGGGGGAGGSFMTTGGDGSDGNGGTRGTAGPAVSAPTVLRAGCDGHTGGNGVNSGSGNPPGPGGAAGGVVYLVAVNTITLSSGAVINVSGAAGQAPGATNSAGGSGGGSGGMIKLDAPMITATGAILMANGAGGSSGASTNGTGNDGSDPTAAAPTSPAPGGPVSSQSGAGGNGFAGTTAATGGSAIGGTSKSPGGSGGGGGGGYVEASAVLTGATVSAGVYSHP